LFFLVPDACFAPLLSECAFRIGGMQIEIVSFYCHLGRMIYSSLSDEQDISYRRNTLIGQVNNVCFFGKLPSAVKARLFLSYCTSYYGCVFYGISHVLSWAISVLHGGRVSEAFGTCPIKHMLSLLCGCLPVYHEICLRSVNFVRPCINHWTLLSSLSHGTAFSMDGLAHQLPVVCVLCTAVFMCCGRSAFYLFNMQCCRFMCLWAFQRWTDINS